MHAERIAEIVAPVGASEPLHVHRGEDECFWLHEGELIVRRGTETLTARPGEFIFLPRDVPHAYRVDGDAPARLLAIWSPGSLKPLSR
jgi:mannose-6-phosphate isomerase-like protein (cupin superfamily)